MRPITAADLMSPEVLTVREDMPVADLAAFLMRHDITGAPVADADGRLVGVVSVVDIADLVSDDAEIAADRSEPDFLYRGREATLSEDELQELEIDDEDLTVADIMTPEIHSVAPSAPVSKIAMKMLREHLHRVLVLDPDDRCVGIVTTSDLLGLLVDEGP
jgi:CBS domain-containing protein